MFMQGASSSADRRLPRWGAYVCPSALLGHSTPFHVEMILSHDVKIDRNTRGGRIWFVTLSAFLKYSCSAICLSLLGVFIKNDRSWASLHTCTIRV